MTTQHRVARGIEALLQIMRVKWRTLLGTGLMLVAGVALVVALVRYDTEKAASPQIVLPYSSFKAQLHAHNVASVTTGPDILEGTTRKAVEEPGSNTVSTAFRTRLPSFGDPGLEAALEADGVAINPSRASFGWDVVASAAALSTLAAILAGFVLIAIVAILTLPPREATRYTDPLHPLLTAFLTLIVASFLFAVLAGGGLSGGTELGPLAEGYVISWILAFGVLQTAVGIVWLLQDYGVPPDVVSAARFMVQMSVVILAASLSGILVQPLYVLNPDSQVLNGAIWIATIALSLLAVPLGTMLNGFDWHADAAAAGPGRSLALLKGLTPYALVLVVVALFAFGVLSALSEEAIRHEGYRVVFTFLAAGQVIFAVLIIGYEMSLPAVQDPPGTQAVEAQPPPPLSHEQRS